MSYLDLLHEGSNIHKVKKIEGGFTIAPTNNTDECLREFQQLISEAVAAGFDVKPHPTQMRSLPGWSGPVYDFAVVMGI
jgi:hypothetical protein